MERLRAFLKTYDPAAVLFYGLLLFVLYKIAAMGAGIFPSVRWVRATIFPLFVLAVLIPAALKRRKIAQMEVNGLVLGMVLAELMGHGRAFNERWQREPRVFIICGVYLIALIVGVVTDIWSRRLAEETRRLREKAERAEKPEREP